MILSARKVKANIIRNTLYLLRSREESKRSFAERSGVTRSTVYKILNGEIQNIQKGTIEKIADFFGVSVRLMEEYDIASMEETENHTAGNRNPISVPVINESNIKTLCYSKISQLITDYPITYCYTEEKNVIGIRLETAKEPFFTKGELLIVRRFFRGNDNELLVTITEGSVEIKSKISHSDILLGYIIEERSSEKI